MHIRKEKEENVFNWNATAGRVNCRRQLKLLFDKAGDVILAKWTSLAASVFLSNFLSCFFFIATARGRKNKRKQMETSFPVIYIEMFFLGS